jgi:hypothetical protein
MIAGAAFVSPGTADASTEHSSAVINLGPHVLPSGSRFRSLIDRKALVFRHSPSIHKLDPLSPLSVGNGEFAFTADITGLQTFPSEYHTHTTPAGAQLNAASVVEGLRALKNCPLAAFLLKKMVGQPGCGAV